MLRRNTAIATVLVLMATCVTYVQARARQDQARPNPDSGYLGVKLGPVSDEIAERLKLESQDGVVVMEILPGSPAERDGFKVDDVVLKVDGTEIGDVQDFVKSVWQAKPDQKVTFEIFREGKKQELTVTLGKRPPGMMQPGHDDHKDKAPATKPD